MAFNQSEVDKLLAQCHRRCCVCHKFTGVKMEVHHIQYRSQRGSDNITNAIPLCLECHAEVNHYNPNHPKGRKFTDEELLEHKTQWLQVCENNPQALISAPRDRDIGPLEGMVQELESNLEIIALVTGTESWMGKIGAPLRTTQYEKAISEGALLLLSDELKKQVNKAYSSVGLINTGVMRYGSIEPEGNAFAEATDRLLEALRAGEEPVKSALGELQNFLKSQSSG